jgi:hypothetical protein
MISTAGCADPISLFGSPLPKVAPRPITRSVFGDIALIAFLIAQCLDGVFTYVGVMTYGLGIEANPVIAAMMASLGHGPGLFSAKIIAAVLGVGLHLREVHRAVAMLATFYFAVAVGPWAMILFL